VVAVEAASQLSLERGKVYVDKPVEVTASHPLRVATRVGLVEHSGTEFEVLSDDRVVRIRVREGQVRFSGATGVLIATVGTELLASSAGGVTQRPVPTFGLDWQWTAALAPGFAVEGRLLSDYLQWISRELGRPLVYANAQAHESAKRTILHGSVHSEATLDALAEVLSSTSLTYELVEGAIRVHSTR
jgi:ferric-dicitrate binding protein FerR (iron transport regulator)